MKRDTYNKDTKLEIIIKKNHKIIVFFEESYYKEIIMDKYKFLIITYFVEKYKCSVLM